VAQEAAKPDGRGPKPGATFLDDDAFVEIGDGTFIGVGCVTFPTYE
jgi:hypothetical protein